MDANRRARVFLVRYTHHFWSGTLVEMISSQKLTITEVSFDAKRYLTSLCQFLPIIFGMKSFFRVSLDYCIQEEQRIEDGFPSFSSLPYSTTVLVLMVKHHTAHIGGEPNQDQDPARG